MVHKLKELITADQMLTWIVICNPDRGRYRMSAGLFTAFYTGVSLWNGEPHDL